jgi:rod shape-determining protein MreD
VTAPAVARRWSDGSAASGLGRRGLSLLREQAVRLRRHVPLATVLLTGIAIHGAVAPHLAIGGAAPQALLIAVVAIAAGRGPRAGAAFGFAAGIGADLFLATPVGTSALAFTLLGHGLGRSGRPRPSTAASALCSPSSACFACRTGAGHCDGGAGTGTGRSGRARRRAEARRAAFRRSLVLTGIGVAAGQLATAGVATALAGLPLPGTPGLLHMAAVAASSAPFGPPAFALVRRLSPAGAAR